MSITASVKTPAQPMAPSELQARLARAYLSGDGAEVDRLLAIINSANYTLPPKTANAA
jgi:hypothetical protein